MSKHSVIVFGMTVVLLMAAHPSTAQDKISEWESLNQEAMELYDSGDYKKAASKAKKAVKVAEKQLGKDHLEVASSLNILASIYTQQERYDKAEELLIRALAIRESSLGPEHLELVDILDNLAYNCRKQERDSEANRLLRRVITIQEMTLGPDHLEVAESLYNLGFYNKLNRQYNKAIDLFERALTIREHSLDSNHVDVTRTLVRLAEIYSRLHINSKAESLYTRVLTIKEQSYGLDHSYLTNTLSSLASVYIELQYFDKADSLCNRALTIDRKSHETDHPVIKRLIDKLDYNEQCKTSALLEYEPVFGAYTKDAFLEYMQSHETGQFRDSIQMHFNGLAEEALNVAKQRGNVSDFTDFLVKWSESDLTDEAQALLDDVKMSRDSMVMAIRASSNPFKTNNIIKFTQDALQILGYEVGRQDGMMDSQTRLVIRDFQSAINVESTGEITRELLAQLLWDLGECTTVAAGYGEDFAVRSADGIMHRYAKQPIRCKSGCSSGVKITGTEFIGIIVSCGGTELFVPFEVHNRLTE